MIRWLPPQRAPFDCAQAGYTVARREPRLGPPSLRPCCCWLFAVPVFAQDLASFEKNVTVKTLPNGLTVVLYRRPEAPVFSFFTLVDAGSAQDPLHKTGLAHMMEHMAFKGTPDIGTTDYAKEKVALQKVEADLRRL